MAIPDDVLSFQPAKALAEALGLGSPAKYTPIDSGTVDTTYGEDEAGVIESLRTTLGEVVAALEAAGLIEEDDE